MNKTVIGITGGIATGKTTVCNIIRNEGYTVIDCDFVSHQVLADKNLGYPNVLNHFGSKILDNDGNIDRKKLGQIVFSDKNKRKALEEILHPIIKEEVLRQIKGTKNELIFIECPLLFETDFKDICDLKVTVFASEPVQIERIIFRDKISKAEAKLRIDAQISLNEKIKKSDYVIDNSDLKDLDKKVLDLIKSIEGKK